MDDKNVKKYFDEIAEEFDGIYDNKNSATNKFLRKSLYERVPLSIDECGSLNDKKVLDVGCGSGRVSFLLAEHGAEVTGIDYAEGMIKLAEHYKSGYSHPEKVSFSQSDFMNDFKDELAFDISMALGVFDYIENPVPFLKKIRNVTKEKFVASFPARYNLQSVVRKIWLTTRNCPVYFYDKNKIKTIFHNAGIDKIKILELPTNSIFTVDYVVVADLSR